MVSQQAATAVNVNSSGLQFPSVQAVSPTNPIVWNAKLIEAYPTEALVTSGSGVLHGIWLECSSYQIWGVQVSNGPFATGTRIGDFSHNVRENLSNAPKETQFYLLDCAFDNGLYVRTIPPGTNVDPGPLSVSLLYK